MNKVLVHKYHGLCKIEEEVELNGNKFIKVTPFSGDTLSLYCPVDKVDEYFRKPISKKEAKKIIEYMENLTDEDVKLASTKQQRTELQEMLYQGDIYKIAFLNIALLKREKEKIEHKQSLSSIEAKIYRSANKMICEELGYSLDKTIEEMNALINQIAGV